MSELNGGRAKAWNIYSSSSSNGSADVNHPWKSFGTSMDAISFGFVATAILISMFLIMAIFEHLFRPNASSHDDSGGMESRQLRKLGNPDTVQTSSYASDFSVVMPGQQYPTFIAQPAPLKLPSCHREGVIYWPSHSHIV
ncbi:hypothetical protein CDL12_24683 [Handroanthus impetiginosus]|uniref:Uncharacterized protein n=1 Tax=Handroanthus impetiginosus TaxID=429701 RepID=A0A2G9GBY6_9LAMI|nr:hypothetical protein CDL12_24683 [Handroanthus impetiginosus]